MTDIQYRFLLSLNSTLMTLLIKPHTNETLAKVAKLQAQIDSVLNAVTVEAA